jgi:hypothetical protein
MSEKCILRITGYNKDGMDVYCIDCENRTPYSQIRAGLFCSESKYIIVDVVNKQLNIIVREAVQCFINTRIK